MDDLTVQDASAEYIADQGGAEADFADREPFLLGNAVAALNAIGETDSKGRVFVDNLADLFSKYPERKSGGTR